MSRNRKIHQTRNPATTEMTANGDMASDTAKMMSESGNMAPYMINHNPAMKVDAVAMLPKDMAMTLLRDMFNMLSS